MVLVIEATPEAIAGATGLCVLAAIGAAVPVRLMKRDLLFVAERLANLLDENRAAILAKQHGIKKTKDNESVGKLFAGFARCGHDLQGRYRRHCREDQTGIRGEREGEDLQKGHAESDRQGSVEDRQESSSGIIVNPTGNTMRSQPDRLRISVPARRYPPSSVLPQQREAIFRPPDVQAVHRCARLMSRKWIMEHHYTYYDYRKFSIPMSETRSDLPAWLATTRSFLFRRESKRCSPISRAGRIQRKPLRRRKKARRFLPGRNRCSLKQIVIRRRGLFHAIFDCRRCSDQGLPEYRQ